MGAMWEKCLNKGVLTQNINMGKALGRKIKRPAGNLGRDFLSRPLNIWYISGDSNPGPTD